MARHPRSVRARPGPCRLARRTRAGRADRPASRHRPHRPREQLGECRDRVGGLECRQDAFGAGRGPHRGDRLAIRGRGDLDPAAFGQRGQLRPDARIVESGRRRVGLDDLAVGVLEHQASATRAGCPVSRRGSPPHVARSPVPSPAASTTASRTVGSPMNRASRPIAFEPPPTQASARSGKPPFHGLELGRRLVADPALEVADDRRDTGAGPSPSPGRSGSSRRS